MRSWPARSSASRGPLPRDPPGRCGAMSDKRPVVHFPGGGRLPFSADMLARAVAVRAEILARPGATLLPSFDVWRAVHDVLAAEAAESSPDNAKAGPGLPTVEGAGPG